MIYKRIPIVKCRLPIRSVGYARAILIAIIVLTSVVAYGQYLPKCHYKLERSGFTIDYDTLNYVPRFVYYKVVGTKIIYQAERGEFDYDYKAINSASPSDYMWTGYDRGHMFPVASCNSYSALRDCMLMTNMAPQTPGLNRGLWKRLENFERRNADPYCYVISGTILSKNPIKLYNKVSIPIQFYKIIYNPKKGMVAFLVGQYDNDDITMYVVTVDDIERLTGIDFFYQMGNSVQNRLESTIAKDEDWLWW